MDDVERIFVFVLLWRPAYKEGLGGSRLTMNSKSDYQMKLATLELLLGSSGNQQSIISSEQNASKLINHISRHYDALSLLDIMPCGVSIATDRSCKTIIHNTMAAEFWRIGRWENLSFSADISPAVEVFSNGRKVLPEEMPIQRAAWNGETVFGTEYEIVWPDGVVKYGLWSARPLYQNGIISGAIATREDITERKRLESELIQNRDKLAMLVSQRTDEVLRLDRLNLVGEMAASIGHEVRNPLTTVRGYLQMFLRKAEVAGYREQFKTMIGELDRANAIISEFLSLAKNKAVELKPYNLNDIVSTLLPLLQAEAFHSGHDINVDMGDIPDINIDEKELRQLVLNLARNGFEAMEPIGRLTIETYAEDDNVVLAVRDTGEGMSPEVLEKIGTPFFTTKDTGTGLGLPVCYRIAERHGAKLDVITSPRGTKFMIVFKLSQS